MIARLGSLWQSFHRLHLAALLADWRRTLLSAMGVGVGVSVVLGTLMLKTELTRPFDAFGPSLTHAAESGVLQVTPNVSGRLPLETVARLRADVPGAQAVIPVVAALTPGEIADDTHGFFLLGGSCRIELLVGPFDCERRSRDVKPAPGPGVPLQLAADIAQQHGWKLGDEVRIPGLPPGSAHLGWTFPEFDRVSRINDGYVLLAPSADAAASMLSSPGFVTAAFVLPRAGSAVTADVDRVIAGIATAGSPRPHQPAVLENAAQSFNLIALCGVLIGFLISLNTVLLAVEDRRTTLGTIGAIGARPVRLLAGMLSEGAMMGMLGGLLGVPGGFLVGTYLVDRFGKSMLAGSGGAIAVHFTVGLIPIGAAAGTICGMLAMSGPAWRLFREGPLATMATAGGVQRVRTLPVWPLIAGALALVGAYLVMTVFQGGSLPLTAGIYGLTAGQLAVALTTVWFAPRGASPLIASLTAVRPDLGRLLRADMTRYVVLFSLSAAILAVGTSMAVGSQSMELLGTKHMAAQKPDRLPSALLIAGQSVLDQRDSGISDATRALITEAAGGGETSARWRSTISSGTLSRLVIGVTPGDWFSAALYEPTGDPAALWQGLARGEIALSEVAAGRLGASAGDLVELPTVAGDRTFRVAGVFRPMMIDDTAVGDIVLAADSLARSDWAAVRDRVAVRYGSAAEATSHRTDFLNLGSGLSVYDDAEWRTAASSGIARLLEPLAVSGYVVMGAAALSILNVFVLGLVQRKRERAALRAIGATPRQEQSVVIAHALVLGLLAAVFGGLGGIGIAYLWSLGSPVFYGTEIRWGFTGSALITGALAALALVLIAAVYPLIHARRLETIEVLRGA